MNMGATFAVAIKRLFGFATRGFGQSYRKTSNDTCEAARSAFPSPKQGGAVQPNLKARALLLHNRSAKGVSAYERVHFILMEGRK
jgi:hypothetical protein